MPRSCLSSSHNYPNCILTIILRKDVQEMKAFAKKWGPVPCILLRLLELPSRQAAPEKEVANAIQNPRSVFAHHNSSTTFSELSTVFFITLNLKATAAYILLMFLLVGLSVSLLIDLSTGKLYRGADCAGRQGRAGSLTLRQL